MRYNWRINAKISTQNEYIHDLPPIRFDDITLGLAIYTVMNVIPPSMQAGASITYGYNMRMELDEIRTAFRSREFPTSSIPRE